MGSPWCTPSEEENQLKALPLKIKEKELDIRQVIIQENQTAGNFIMVKVVRIALQLRYHKLSQYLSILTSERGHYN